MSPGQPGVPGCAGEGAQAVWGVSGYPGPAITPSFAQNPGTYKSGGSFPATRACLDIPEYHRLPENTYYSPSGPTYPCETLSCLYFLSAHIFWTENIH